MILNLLFLKPRNQNNNSNGTKGHYNFDKWDSINLKKIYNNINMTVTKLEGCKILLFIYSARIALVVYEIIHL